MTAPAPTGICSGAMGEDSPTIDLTATRGRITVKLRAQHLGRDLAVTIGGGDLPHVGAVAVSQPRPSHDPGGRTSASTSVITLLGHKEDELARRTAASLASGLGVAVTVACGIHVDAITTAEIRDVESIVEELTVALLRRLDERR